MADAQQHAGSLSEILRRLMFEKKLKTTELARRVNLPQPTVHRIVSGQARNPHQSSLNPLAQYFGLSVEQLRGQAPLPEELSREQALVAQHNSTIIPILNWDELAQQDSLDSKHHKTLMLSPTMNPLCFAVLLNNSSMAPSFTNGTTLIFDPDKPYQDRSYVLVHIKESDSYTFRQLLLDTDYQYLKPLNPDLHKFPMRILTPEDNIVATLVEARRNYEDL